MFALANASGEDWVLARYSSASHAVTLAGPILAVIAAIRAPTLDRFVSRRGPARGRHGVWMNAFWPLAVLGPAAGMFAIVSATRAMPTDVRQLTILAVVGLKLMACVCLGVLVGHIAHPIIGVPLVALGLYGWLTLPATGSSVLLRQLNGSFVACCTVDQQPATTMLFASGVVLCLFVVGVLLVANLASKSLRAIGLGAVVLVSALGGVVTANTAGAEPNLLAVQERSDDPVCRTRDGVSLCVWPENRSALPTTLAIYLDVTARLAKYGVELPRRYSERSELGYSPTDVPRGASDTDLRFSLVSGVLPDPSTCASHRDRNVFAVYDQALAWLALSSGAPAADVEVRLGPDALDVVQARVTLMPPYRQGTWFQEQTETLSTSCD